MMLPTLLTENATMVNDWGFPDQPRYRKILEKAGLPPTLEGVKKLIDYQKLTDGDYDGMLLMSKLMHAKMAAFASLWGDDKALERWNGKGVAKWGQTVLADAPNHYRKVIELDKLLEHPKNAPMMAAWEKYSQAHKGGQDVPAFREGPDADTEPTLLQQGAQAVRGVQRAVRNATSAPAVDDSSLFQRALKRIQSNGLSRF
jgi:hypothetical protein